MSHIFGQTAGEDWLNLDNDYFHKVPVLRTDWPFTVPSLQSDSFNLQGLHMISADNGGPIMMVRDEESQKFSKDWSQKLRVFTSAGTLLSEFPWKHTEIVTYGWTYKEAIAAVTRDGTVYVYNIHGKQQLEALIDPPGDDSYIANADVRVNQAHISKFGIACTFLTQPGQVAFYSFAKNTTTWYKSLPQNTNITAISQLVPSLSHIANADYTARQYNEKIEYLLGDLNSEERYKVLPKILIAVNTQKPTNNSLTMDTSSKPIPDNSGSTTLFILSPQHAVEYHSVVETQIDMITIDSSQQYAALWSNGSTTVFCFSLESSSVLYEFKSKSKRIPQNVLFLGSASLLTPAQDPSLTKRHVGEESAPKLFLHWNINDKSVAMIVSNNAFRSYNWSTTTIVCGEPDYSIRVISEANCELIQCLHPDIVDTIRKDAVSPATTLLSSYLQFKTNHLQSDVLLRRLIDAGQLGQAIEAVLSAASHTIHEPTQTLLLQVCSYGRTYVSPDEDVSSDLFVDVCKYARLLFNLRTTKLGVPLTYFLLTQYYTAELLILRMVSYQQHALAVKLCSMLKIPADVVIQDWCIVKLLHSGDITHSANSQFGLVSSTTKKQYPAGMNATTRALMQKLNPIQNLIISMSTKLQLCKTKSYVTLALTAAKNHQMAVAVALTYHEPLITHQAALFVSLGEFNLALRAAYLSNDYELLIVTLTKIYDNIKSKGAFFQLIHLYPDVEATWVRYLAKSQWDLYLEYTQTIPALTVPQSSAWISSQRFINQAHYQLHISPEHDKTSTQQLISNFKQLAIEAQSDKTGAVPSGIAQIITEQDQLLQLQHKFIGASQLSEKSLGLSLIETIRVLYSTNQEPLVNMLKDLFKLTEQRLAYVYIPVLVEREDWTTLQQKSGQFASVLGGFEFIIETLVDAKATQQAIRYIDLLPKNGRTLDWLVSLGLDIEGLRTLRASVSGNPASTAVIDKIIAEMTR